MANKGIDGGEVLQAVFAQVDALQARILSRVGRGVPRGERPRANLDHGRPRLALSRHLQHIAE